MNRRDCEINMKVKIISYGDSKHKRKLCFRFGVIDTLYDNYALVKINIGGYKECYFYNQLERADSNGEE